MSLLKRSIVPVTIIVTVLLAGVCLARLDTNKTAPDFSLKDVDAKVYDLASMKDKPMIILYFFDAASRPSQECLLTMDNLAKKYKDADLSVLGITSSSKDKVAEFIKQANPVFPILLDDSDISSQYHAKAILPTSYILGPDLRPIDFFQGGGKTTNVMLSRLAERKLQQNQTILANAISEEVIKKDPKNSKAMMVKGYAALKTGDSSGAEKTFTSLSETKGDDSVLGKEGLLSVYAAQGKTDKALKLAQEVEKKAPERSYAHVIKGDILYSRNQKDLAESEYQKAVKKGSGEPFQKAAASNKLGRLYASLGKYERSRELYDQAVVLDPYYIEAMTNKGVTYEKQGNWDKALETYKKGEGIDKNDVFAMALVKRATEMLAVKNDEQRSERIDKLVKDLSKRYRSHKAASDKKTEDSWTSRPMVISFVDFNETGSLSERDGFSTVLTTELSDKLNSSGRVKVVERILIERLLEELNLGSSDLADPQTALKLGRVLAAKIMGTGTMLHTPSGTMLSLRLVDTETSLIPKVLNREIGPGTSLKEELYSLNREILSSIMEKYPLKAYVVKVIDDDNVMINLGANQGVVMGSTFEIIQDQEPIEYKGRKLKAEPKSIAGMKVVKVEPDLSYCRVVDTSRPIKSDDKAVEKIAARISDK